MTAAACFKVTMKSIPVFIEYLNNLSVHILIIVLIIVKYLFNFFMCFLCSPGSKVYV